MAKKILTPSSLLSVQNILLLATAWATFALLFFLLFSVPLPGQERPGWYSIITYVLEVFAFLGAGLLCFRNWRSPQIVSGRTVWLAIGLGMFSYFIGSLILAYWELGLGLSPSVSPGDFFFLLTYVLLGWGMLMAVLSRQLSLSPLQWLVVIGILVGSVLLAWLVVYHAPSETEAAFPGLMEPAIAQTAPAPPATPAPVAPVEAVAADGNVPGWAIALENTLQPYVPIVTLLYVVGDIILVVMATTLLLAFWGGRFSLSWRFISAAALCFYIADIWFAYASNYIENYQTGSLPEVFWIFSGCLFAIGAALEYDLSTRSRRTSRRRA